MMKKILLTTGFAMAMLLLGCNKEATIDQTPTNGATTIKAYAASTRTSLGEDFSVNWSEGDELILYKFDGANSPFDTAFTYIGNNTFTAQSELPDGLYKAVYTTSDKKMLIYPAEGTINRLDATQSQDCTAPRAHIAKNDGLVGEAQLSTSETSEFAMKHLYALVEISIKNLSGAAVEITKVTIDADTELAGDVAITDFANGVCSKVANSQSFKSVELSMTNGAIAQNSVVKGYLLTLPVANYTGQMTITVETADGVLYSETRNATGLNFAAGSYNTATIRLEDKTRSLLAVGDNQATFLPNNDALVRTIEFNAPEAWTASVLATRADSDWVTVTPSSGTAGLVTLAISTSKNSTEDDRNTTITISSGQKIARIGVKQPGMVARKLQKIEFVSNGVPTPDDDLTFEYDATGNLITMAGFALTHPEVSKMRLYSTFDRETDHYESEYIYTFADGYTSSCNYIGKIESEFETTTENSTMTYTYVRNQLKKIHTTGELISNIPEDNETINNTMDFHWSFDNINSIIDADNVVLAEYTYSGGERNNINIDIFSILNQTKFIHIYDYAAFNNSSGTRCWNLPTSVKLANESTARNIYYIREQLHGPITKIHFGRPEVDYLLLTYEL